MRGRHVCGRVVPIACTAPPDPLVAVDDDVAAEAARVDAGASAEFRASEVRSVHLRKVFDDNGKEKVAVADVTFACGVGECFGLLGKWGMRPLCSWV